MTADDLLAALDRVPDNHRAWLWCLANESDRPLPELLAEAVRKGVSRMRSEERYAKRVADRRKVSPPPQ